MITKLKIKNYTLLKDVVIDFKNGFTVVSGETGSGKSIMLDALALLLGKRAERFSTNKSHHKTIIEGSFNIKKSNSAFFEKNDLDFEEKTLVRREFNAQGKSRAFINDTPVLLSILSEFGSQVVEIHAQHQWTLLKEEIARFELIDELAKSRKEFESYQEELIIYNQLCKDLALIEKEGFFTESKLEFLKYQLEELESCNLISGEQERIQEQISFLENIERVSLVISASEEYLNNEKGILSQLSNLKRKLLTFETFSNLHERIESVIIELNDVNTDISSFKNNLEFDPERLTQLNARIDIINKLLLKHKKDSIEELLDYKRDIYSKIKLSKSLEENRKAKKEQIKNQSLLLQKSAIILDQKRNKILPSLKKEIESHLMALGMPYAKFMVEFSAVDNFHRYGNTSVSFFFSANKGIPLQELSKVASGGELSRLMLTMKYISAKSSNIDTLFFDEIDIGVSGKIAALMGSMMKEISKSTQLIAISHLPQIASKANQHLKTIKLVDGNETTSNVISLSMDDRIKEIATLLSGKAVTSEAFENARVLLSQ